MMRTSYIQWNDDAYFVLDQHAQLDLYSATSLQQQSVGSDVASLRHIILIPSQPVSRRAANANFMVFYLTNWGSNPQSTTLEASMLNMHRCVLNQLYS